MNRNANSIKAAALVMVRVFKLMYWLGLFFILDLTTPSISNSACPPSSIGMGRALNIANPMFNMAASIMAVSSVAHHVPVSMFFAVMLAPISVRGLSGVLSPFLRFW